ncbi:uncharacterized protein LOC114331531 [Diabrotica virgifera virgifera]|uniref:Uncharacterized protein LOC114331531 n=1 Tax=Diabrotica virgifera virgifera TaxID=50390 RepID=A0A6P7FWC8_DIAVI|nr:uncharacterized protein LOC114331531 [Diabrotica virgifera virgifera]
MMDSTSANNSALVFQRFASTILKFGSCKWKTNLHYNITSDATKFNYIVANLETVYISEVRDIIVSPPATERYVKLKSELIKRLSESQQQTIKRLLEHEELGDRQPSQFLHLQSLAGTTVPDNIVRSLRLGRLPSSTQAILATQAKASLDAVAELANTISESIAPSVHMSEVSNARESTIDKLTA